MSSETHSLAIATKGLASVLISPIALSIPSNGGLKNPIFYTRCIWDTGCSQTTITQEVVDKLGLVETGFCYVHTASHRNRKTRTYQVDIYLNDKLVFPTLTVNLGVIVDGIDCLLGMDIISKGDFSLMAQDGNTHLKFRYPSINSQ